MAALQVCAGAPAERRSEGEERVHECLARLEIPFTRVDHEAAFTMEDCAAISAAPFTCCVCRRTSRFPPMISLS